MTLSLPTKKYPVVLADFPWPYYGNPNKPQAAGKHYPLMTAEEIYQFPMGDLLEKRSVLFLWATSPAMNIAFKAIENWGLYYRGVAFVWIKTNKNGIPIVGQGVRPSLIKSLNEFVLWASPQAKGRPLPLKTEKMGQNIFASRPGNIHSAKPDEAHGRIESLLSGPYLELFSRKRREGWDAWGDEVNSRP